MNNLVVQLLLKTGTFSQDLKTARGQVQNFQKGCQTAGKSVSAFSSALGINIGTLTKFGGAIGAAALAGKGFKAVIESNQVTSDAFAGVMYAAKTAVNELAYAIGTFDFSNFQNGLSDLISRAQDAYTAIDQLGNSLMSYNVIQAEANAAVAAARAAENNPNLSPDQKKAAADYAADMMAQLKETTEVVKDDIVKTIVSEVNAKGGHLSGDQGIQIAKNMITLDGKKIRDDVKSMMKTRQTQYNMAVAALRTEFNVDEYDYTNAGFTGSTGNTLLYNNERAQQDNENVRKFKEALRGVNEEFSDLHTYNVLLVKEKNEELEKTGQLLVTYYNMSASLSNQERRLDNVNKKLDGATGATKEGNQAVQESLDYWKKIQQEALKVRDASVYMTEAWIRANNEFEKASENIEEITAKMERAKTNSKYGDALKDMLTPITGPDLQGQVINTQPDKLAGEETKKTLAELRVDLAAYKAAAENAFDDETIIHLNQKMKELSGEIKRRENLGLDINGPDSKAVSEWDHFNDVMSNTSTIVSNLAETFQEGTKVTTASILRMVSTSLPALYSLATAVAALAGTEAIQKAVESSQHWIEAIAAVTALGAVVASAISSVKSQKFANGGIVGGSSFTGDRVTAQVNSGEMILNKTQQANLFKMANGGVRGGQVEFHISGTELVGVLNNQTRKNKLIR